MVVGRPLVDGAGGGGVGQAGVVRVVGQHGVGRLVVAAVVVEADEAVARGRLHQPPRPGQRQHGVADLGGGGQLLLAPDGVARGQEQPGERAGGPVGGGGAGVGLHQARFGSVPAEGEQAVRVEGSAVQEVAQRSGGQAAGGAVGEGGVAGERSGPQGGGGGEAVGERAALVDGGSVAAEGVRVSREVGREPAPVLGQQRCVAREVGVEHRVEVEGPSVVVVEGARPAVGVPAIAEVEALDPLQSPAHRGPCLLLLDAGLGEEAADGEREEMPVVVVGGPAQGVREPASHPASDGSVETVPQPGPGQAEREGDGGGLHHGLAAVGDRRPGLAVAVREVALGRGRTCAGVEPAGVVLQHAVRVGAAGARDTQRGEEKGTGETFERVGAAARPARTVAGKADERPAGARVRADGGEQVVGRRLPVLPGPAGVRAELSVLGRQGHGCVLRRSVPPERGSPGGI